MNYKKTNYILFIIHCQNSVILIPKFYQIVTTINVCLQLSNTNVATCILGQRLITNYDLS